MRRYDEALTTGAGQRVTWGFELECITLNDHINIKNFWSYLKNIRHLSGEFEEEGDGSVEIVKNDYSEKKIYKIFENQELEKEYNPYKRTQEIDIYNDLMHKIYQDGFEYKTGILSADLATFVNVYTTLKNLFNAKVNRQFSFNIPGILAPVIKVTDFTIQINGIHWASGWFYQQGLETGNYSITYDEFYRSRDPLLLININEPEMLEASMTSSTLILGTVNYNREKAEFSNFKPVNIKSSPPKEQTIKIYDIPLAYTNRTCGFHIHIGLNFKTKFMEELLWIWFQMSISNMEEMEDQIDLHTKKRFFDFYKYEKDNVEISFVSDHYAPDDAYEYNYFDFTSKERLEKSILSILDKKKTEILRKYSLARLHAEYATIEWRGPRGFIEEGADLKDLFLNFVYPFMQFITTLSENEFINTKEFKYNKKEFFHLLEKSGSFHKQILNFNKDISWKVLNKDYDTTKFARKKLYTILDSKLYKISDNVEFVERTINDEDVIVIKDGRIEAKKKIELPFKLRNGDTGTLKNFIIKNFEDLEYLTGRFINCTIIGRLKCRSSQPFPNHVKMCLIDEMIIDNDSTTDIVFNTIKTLKIEDIRSMVPEDIDSLQSNLIHNCDIYLTKKLRARQGLDNDYFYIDHDDDLNIYKEIFKNNKIMNIRVFDLMTYKQIQLKNLKDIEPEFYELIKKEKAKITSAKRKNNV